MNIRVVHIPLAFILLAMLAATRGVSAETYQLEPGPGSRIQDLIDDVVVAGDVILLEAGDHLVESVIDLRGLSITLRGETDRLGRPVARLVGAGGTGILSCRSGETLETRIETLEVVDGDIDLGGGLLIVDSSPSLFGVRFIGHNNFPLQRIINDGLGTEGDGSGIVGQ